MNGRGAHYLDVPVEASPSRQALFDALAHGRPTRLGKAQTAAFNLVRYFTGREPDEAAAGVSRAFMHMATQGLVSIDGFNVTLKPDVASHWREIRSKQLSGMVKRGREHVPPLNPDNYPEDLLWEQCPPIPGVLIRVSEAADYVQEVRERATRDQIKVGLITGNINNGRIRIYAAEEDGESVRQWLKETLESICGPMKGVALNRKPIMWRPIYMMPDPWRETLVSQYASWLSRRMKQSDIAQLLYHLKGDYTDMNQWVAGEVLELMIRFDDSKETRSGLPMTFPAYALTKMGKAIQDMHRERLTRRGADLQSAVNKYAREHDIEFGDVPESVIADITGIPIAHARQFRQMYATASSIHTPIAIDAATFDYSGTLPASWDIVETSQIESIVDQSASVVETVHAGISVSGQSVNSQLSQILADSADDLADPLAFYAIYASTYLGTDLSIIAALSGTTEEELANRMGSLLSTTKTRALEEIGEGTLLD